MLTTLLKRYAREVRQGAKRIEDDLHDVKVLLTELIHVSRGGYTEAYGLMLRGKLRRPPKEE